MTELEAYLNGVVFEQEKPEEDVDDEEDVEDEELDEEDPEDEDENEENEEDEDSEDEDEEEQSGRRDQGEAAVSKIKKISANIRKTISKIGQAKARIDKTNFMPILTFSENAEVKKAKQIVRMKSSDFKQLEKQIKRKRTDLKAQFTAEKKKITSQQDQVKTKLMELEASKAAAWVRFWSKVKSIIAPALPIIAKVGLIVLAVVLVIGVIYYVFSFASGEDGWESVGGSTGAQFYGVRVVYRDPDKELQELATSYGNLVFDMIENAENNLQSINLDIQVEKPTNYADLIAGTSSNLNANNLILEVAKVMYLQDQGSEADNTLTLPQVLQGINYFGINNGTGGVYQEIVNKVWAYFAKTENQSLVTENSNDVEIDFSNNQDSTVLSIKSSFMEVVSTHIARTEKLFVKDVVYTSNESALKITEAKDYEAIIYMPKTALKIDLLSIKAIGENLDLKATVLSNGTTKELTHFYEEELGLNIYDAGNNANITVQPVQAPNLTQDFDGALSEIGTQEGGMNYLQIAVDKNGNELEGVYTYTRNIFLIMFESESPFMFAEAGFDITEG